MTKQVALADLTYEKLKRSRLPGESFSETIERLLASGRRDPLRFAARVPKSPIPSKERLRRIEADREATRTDA